MSPGNPLLGCRILVIEDEYIIAEEIRDELERAGAVVVGPVASIEGALALLERETQLHGAVLDINLRGKQSYGVADELLRRKVPLLLATGYAQDAILEPYQHLPRCHKPTAPGFVVDTISRAIRG